MLLKYLNNFRLKKKIKNVRNKVRTDYIKQK